MWLAVCLGDDVVEIWEAFVTFCFFPVLVLIVYAADKNWFMGAKGEHVHYICIFAYLRVCICTFMYL